MPQKETYNVRMQLQRMEDEKDGHADDEDGRTDDEEVYHGALPFRIDIPLNRPFSFS
ncbi:hypothetical protein B0H19DRAFT_1253746 [Mycena capillaripes]|nr:hypothetical protein B0H19DRAFT_1253746 [Mycena capillaripes]